MSDNKTDIWHRGAASAPGVVNLNIKPAMALLLLLLNFIVGFIITGFLTYFLIIPATGGRPAATVYLSTIVQDIFLFIAPPLVTAMLATRRPARLLGLMEHPKAIGLLLVGLMFVVSVPAQEFLIYCNYHLEWISQELADYAREIEAHASTAVGALVGNTSVAALILNILVVGVAAGFSEELLFRGGILKLLLCTRMNRHVAVWLVAFIFSVIHFQFLGFVPRMLLGAYFGYLLLWSRSLWLPVAAHVLNNTVYVVTAWFSVRREGIAALDAEPEVWSWPITAMSFAAVIVTLYFLYRVNSSASPSAGNLER